MIHLRVVTPPTVTPMLVEDLRHIDAVLNLVVLPGASRHPDGDAIDLDVLNGAANSVIAHVYKAGAVENGSMVIEPVGACMSDTAESAEHEQSRFQSFAPIWELVDARIRNDSIYPPSWFALLIIAGVIGAVGILTNSQILVVAAMVVGPEYGAITAVARSGTRRDGKTARRGLVALTVGFAAAIVASLALALIIRGTAHTPRAFELGLRPVSNLINTPNVFSVIVALLAAIVGIISLTESRASTLIGVFISVTTIPAASDIGLSLGYGSWSEAWGSFLQLLLNVAILIVVGTAMLVVQKRLWDRFAPVAEVRPLSP